jgi:site-specific recombinase XerD
MEIKTKNIDALIKVCEEHLRKTGYSETCVSLHLHKWQKGIKRFMDEKGISEYNSEIGDEYLRINSTGQSRTRVQEKYRNIHILNEYLESGTIRKRIVSLVVHPLPGEIGEVAQLFLRSLKELRRSDRTIKEHHRMLYYFISAMEIKSKNKIEKITEQDVLDFINTAQYGKVKHFKTIRLFCRFLYEQKFVTCNLEYVLGKNNFPKREKLPSIYSAEEIKQIETSVEQSSASGKRNYAILLLATRLGLRNSDICGLQFSNLDWDRNTIRLIQQKTGREVELPLMAEVGEAIINYLRHGRPLSGLSQIFLTAQAPYQVLRYEALSCMIARLMKESGVNANQRNLGPHVLRHSLASQLLKNGISLPVISEALGHAKTQTTMEYLRIDLDRLVKCALHVPIVNQAFYEQKGGVFYE